MDRVMKRRSIPVQLNSQNEKYNDIVRAAYNKLSEENVRKRKEEYLKEKEEYEKEMERLVKLIVRKARVQVKIHYLDRVKILKHKMSRTIQIAKAWTNAVISERDALEIKNLGAYGKEKLAELNELYNIAVSSQRKILKIAEMLSSHPRAKAASSGAVALDKGKKSQQKIHTMHQGPDNDEELKYQSAEEGGGDEDDGADEIDEEGSEEDERHTE
ncbi:uncharacterized protein LOC113782140 [Coffea eugenioides]|uniref:uncharacterized protein LOC113782140 n=1 Tax=Coffea eugenioides TaxID=49369 RepID=UPI000F615B81|nr:uncharacterized protein LOC113782140 [Coffea eugenioides]